MAPAEGGAVKYEELVRFDPRDSLCLYQPGIEDLGGDPPTTCCHR